MRPDLHFLYAVFEETLIIVAFVREIHRAQGRVDRKEAIVELTDTICKRSLVGESKPGIGVGSGPFN
jgi:hypothetical protein